MKSISKTKQLNLPWHWFSFKRLLSAHAPEICDSRFKRESRESITNAPLQSPNSHLLPQYFFVEY